MQGVQDVLAAMRGVGSVQELRAAKVSGQRLRVNSHIHLPPNFSAFVTVQQAVDLAASQDVKVVGVTNYYDYGVYGDFAVAARKAGIFPLFGLEIISLIDELVQGGVKINDPGNPGRLYICGKGVTRLDPVPAEAMEVLLSIRRSDAQRMAEMIGKLSGVFVAAGVDLGLTEESVKQMIVRRHGCSVDSVWIQERHIAQAFQEALFARVPEGQRGALLSKLYGAAPKAPLNDAVKTQNEIRANLLRSGKPAFVVERFVSYPEARKMILGMGGIPCYPTLADGANPICAYEDPVEKLIGNIRDLGVGMAEFIPVRNSPQVLSQYVKAMRAAGLAVVGGTEHNTLDLLPIEPKCVGGAEVPEDVKEIFWEGACVVAAHQFLVLHGQCGFVDDAGQPCRGYVSDDARIRDFARIGAAVIAGYCKQ